MTGYSHFVRNCRMRHDFADQIQVRHCHGNGENYDTWVSGEEALQRLESDAAEQSIRGLRHLKWQQIREWKDKLPDDVRDQLKSRLRDRLADGLEGTIGPNVIGDSMADIVRGHDTDADSDADQRLKWSALLTDSAFREEVLKLAWIQLEGSFPDTGPADEPDDWV